MVYIMLSIDRTVFLIIDKITGKLSEQKPTLTFTGHMFSQSLCFVLLSRIRSVSEYVNRLLMVQIYYMQS